MARSANKGAKWKWDQVRLDACKLVAEGLLSYDKISAQLGVPPSTLDYWIDNPEFEAKRDEIYRAYERRVMRTGIAVRANRVAYLQNLHDRQHMIVAARAVKLVAATGGESGLIAIEERQTGYGEGATMVEDEVFDAALSKELRATIAQVADETGQSVAKHEISGPDGGPITIGVIDDIAARVRSAKEAQAKENEPGSTA